jgi:lipopolysaccharide biosynthesis protein
MKALCLFSSYYESGPMPYDMVCYLKELKRHCQTVVFITNEKAFLENELQFCRDFGIEFLPVENDGFDFGMWRKALKVFPPDTYDKVLLVNDSCILFKKLDNVFEKIEGSDWDYAGLLDSMQIQYHLHSYFLVIGKKAFTLLRQYFDEHNSQTNIYQTIRTFEVGLSVYMEQCGMKLGSVYHHNVCAPDLNPAYSGIEPLIKEGFPLIKKKIMFGTFRKPEIRSLIRNGFKWSSDYYFDLIVKNTLAHEAILDFELLKKECDAHSNKLRNGWYTLYNFIVGMARRIPGVKQVYRFIFVR